jgi:hypothetical protein
MQMKYILCLFILLSTAKVNCMGVDNESDKPVVYASVTTPNLWDIGDRQAYLVITDQNWSKYYPKPPAGSDFANSIYVVASMGMQPNPGHRIKILQIKQQKERIIVTVELLQPEPKKVYAQMIVTPIAVAEVKKKQLEPYHRLEFVFTDQKGREIATEKTEF